MAKCSKCKVPQAMAGYCHECKREYDKHRIDRYDYYITHIARVRSEISMHKRYINRLDRRLNSLLRTLWRISNQVL